MIVQLAAIFLSVAFLRNVYAQSSSSTCSSPSLGIQFYTWDREKSCVPLEYRLPRNELEVSQIILTAAESQEKVKVLGAGMSFSGVQLLDDEAGIMISLDKMNKILNVDDTLVEVEAGIRIRELCEVLATDYKLALPNMGATATQSIVGAASTGTHGTGTALGAIATQIVALRIVDSRGVIHTASATDNKALFDAARVGVGAVGIITSVTLQTVPIWKMKETFIPYSLTQLLKDLPTLMARYPRLQWSWLPYTDNATVIIREDVDLATPLYPAEPDGGCWSTSQPTSPTCTDVSYKTLTDSEAHYEARTLYTEMEMFIPIEEAENAVLEYIEWMDSVKHLHDPNVYLSVMLRYIAADDIYLSPMYKRDSAVMSFIVSGDQQTSGNQTEFSLYAHGLQKMCETNYKGRPHWGKVNYATGGGVTPMYLSGAYAETWEEFKKVAYQMDPTGMFQNFYLQERMGVVRREDKVV